MTPCHLLGWEPLHLRLLAQIEIKHNVTDDLDRLPTPVSIKRIASLKVVAPGPSQLGTREPPNPNRPIPEFLPFRLNPLFGHQAFPGLRMQTRAPGNLGRTRRRGGRIRIGDNSTGE